MKKLAVLLLCTVLLLELAGCGGAPSYRDGVYTAHADGFDESDWRDVVTVTIQNGRISQVDWDAFNPQGESKKQLSQEGLYSMVAGGAKSEWHEQARSMEDELIRQQDPAKLQIRSDGKSDGISGVSIVVTGFAELAHEALVQAK